MGVDAGYIDADLLIAAGRDHGVELLGPAKAATGWQATAGDGYTLSDFTINWDKEPRRPDRDPEDRPESNASVQRDRADAASKR
ncbi:hypothetical protein AB0H42_34645 [Nocardia sp. NPDC050799]|uniref:hypothetical protein n=1 Tax=Nocardia sp. NPDC050799 TaxID=3154842 RepID=UPI003404FF8A